MIKINDEINIYFPLKMKPRNQQIEMLNFIKKSINTSKKYILLNASVGSGKSYLTVMFANWYKNHINKNANFDIITNSKILQDQYMNDYPFMKILKGRANYYCEPYDTNCSLGMEICKTDGPKCGSDCPYTKAKEHWQNSNISLTNFHMFNTFAIYTKMIKDDRKSNVLIIDEAHDFEAVFCDFISTSLSAKALKKYGFDLKEIEDYDDKIRRIKTIDQYVSFIENKFNQDIDKKINWLDKEKQGKSTKIRNKYANYISHCESQKGKFSYLVEEYKINKDNWVLNITTNEHDKMYSGIVLDAKPVWGNKNLKNMIFKYYDHVIFMSGSLLNKEMFSYINGIHPKLTSYLEIDSDFPLKNRPIYYMKGIGKMSFNKKYETFSSQLKYIKKILKKHKNEKVIIHTFTYEIANWVKERLNDSRLIFHEQDNRDEMLQTFMASDEAKVFVSPSLISGFDFSDDLARAQIILKIPYPNLGSENIKQRMKTNDTWFGWKTVVDIIQMYGRTTRSKEDFSSTYILDDSFSDVLKYSSHMIPRYISDAIKIINI